MHKIDMIGLSIVLILLSAICIVTYSKCTRIATPVETQVDQLGETKATMLLQSGDCKVYRIVVDSCVIVANTKGGLILIGGVR